MSTKGTPAGLNAVHPCLRPCGPMNTGGPKLRPLIAARCWPVVSPAPLQSAMSASADAKRCTDIRRRLSGFDLRPTRLPSVYHFSAHKGQDLADGLPGCEAIKKADSANGRTVVLNARAKEFVRYLGRHHCRAAMKQATEVIALDSGWLLQVIPKPKALPVQLPQLRPIPGRLLEELEASTRSRSGPLHGRHAGQRDYALMYPEQTEQLVMVNRLSGKTGRPSCALFQSIDLATKAELGKTAEGIRAYQESTYNVEYLGSLNTIAGSRCRQACTPVKTRSWVAWNQALTRTGLLPKPGGARFRTSADCPNAIAHW